MSVRIAHASINENGKAHGGLPGDQTGKEVCIRDWYYKDWDYVLRPISPEVAEKSAAFAEKAAKNEHVGYDQDTRNTLFPVAKQVNFDPDLINVLCNTDCSEFVSTAAYAAGVPIDMSGNAPTTSTMKKIFKNTGFYKVLEGAEYTTTDKNLQRGDILVKTGSHTVIVIYNSESPKTNDQEIKASTTTEESKTVQSSIIERHSQNCTEMIKGFEGCRLQAYQCAAGVWTIGYGHTNGVYPGQVINQDTADNLLEADIDKFDIHVASYNSKYHWTQNEFDALVSFAFNLGTIKKLTNNGKRSKKEIAEHMPDYCHAAGKVITGLVNRRKKEQALFMKDGLGEEAQASSQTSNTSTSYTSSTSSPSSYIDIEQVAKDVIYGKYSSGDQRKEALKQAGYDYSLVQKRVNELIKPTKSLEQVAQEVIQGVYGNGEDRKLNLQKTGFNPSEVQQKVNELLNSNSQHHVYYTVKEGDTLWSISRRYGFTVDQLVQLNNIQDRSKIFVGQLLMLY